MCVYPKTVFCCNHVQLGEFPVRICEEQKSYLDGAINEPCDEIRSHALSTVKQPFECIYCKEKKAALQEKLSEARKLIAEMKVKLQESHGHIFEDKDHKDESLDSLEEEAERALCLQSGEFGDEKGLVQPALLDPVEFLRKRLSDKYAHLMMDATEQDI